MPVHEDQRTVVKHSQIVDSALALTELGSQRPIRLCTIRSGLNKPGHFVRKCTPMSGNKKEDQGAAASSARAIASSSLPLNFAHNQHAPCAEKSLHHAMNQHGKTFKPGANPLPACSDSFFCEINWLFVCPFNPPQQNTAPSRPGNPR